MPLLRSLLSSCCFAVAAVAVVAQDPGGGDASGHWAFRPIARPALPAVRAADWCRNGVDHFVLAALEARGLSPSLPAEPVTWLRRVSLDLTGLPPTPDEVAAFVADGAPDARARAVDRLLASARYGERQAQWWLDLARYADSQGYEKDDLRPGMWRYRDWVIAAFNRDLPFDRFTIEQLAGDLLPDADLETRVATAFHRQTMTNTEGGTDDEEFRTAAVVDRANTTATVWLGATLGCAQCHDHKYDPYSQREYFRFYAFFDQTEDNDQPDDRPTLRAPTAAQLRRQRELDGERAELQQQLHGDAAAMAAWAAAARTAAASLAAAQPALSPWQLLGPVPAADLRRAHHTAFAPETAGVQLDGRQEGRAWVTRADWRDGAVHALQGDNAAFYLWRTIHATAAADAVLALGSDDAIKVWWNGSEVLARETARAAAPDQEFVPVAIAAGDNTLLLKISNGGGPAGFYFDLRPLAVSAAVVAALAVPPEQRDEAQRSAIAAARVALDPALAPLRARLAALDAEAERHQGPLLPVLRELPPDRARTTRLLRRGSFLTPGEVVTPDTPACLPPLGDRPRNRLGLASWLVSDEHPLTARVQVNRLFEQLFGRGLVPTSEDFGSQGEPPSHPELLDWLAAEFRDGGWSLKRLLRTLVLSATYGQSSRADGERLERDPDNRWLSRGPRFRLPAEALRDQALFVSGLLVEQQGGPSVMPPQPDGIWLQIYSGARWQTATGPGRHRRSLYTFWRRTSPHPAMLAFDAPSREDCVVRRSRTNTPLQALVTWNDPQFVEAAQALAARVCREATGDFARVDRLWRLCLLRPPTAAESAELLALVTQERNAFLVDVAAARALLGAELATRDDAECAGLAAFVVAANVVLNLDEFLTRG